MSKCSECIWVVWRLSPDDTVQFVYTCGEDVEVTKSLTYLGSVVHQDVPPWTGLAHGVTDSLITSRLYDVVCIYVRIQRVESLKHLCPVLYCMTVRYAQ